MKKVIKLLAFLCDYIKTLIKSMIYHKDKMILIGTPLHGNLGDQAITIAEYQFIQDINPKCRIIEIPSRYISKVPFLYNIIIRKNKILIHGGGFIGDLWMDEENMILQVVEKYTKNQIIILPQTIFYQTEAEEKRAQKVFSSHPNLWICTREKASEKKAKEIFPACHILLIPDMVLYAQFLYKKQKRDKILLCLRNDKERKLSTSAEQKIIEQVKEYGMDMPVRYTDTVIKGKVLPSQREKEVQKKLEEFAGASLIITDRLHGMVFAAITETPCIVLSNNNYKVRGVYEWIQHLPYICYVENMDELEAAIKKVIGLRACKYGNEKLKSYYKKLEQVVHQEY